MQVAGKCPPTPDALRAAADHGFETVELHLPLDVLASPVDELAEAVAASPVSVASVHTPHVRPSDIESMRAADELAVALDAYLVVHTQYANLTHVPDFEAIEFDAPYGYENPAGASVRHVRNLVLDPGHDVVVDTAHLFMAHADYLTELRVLLRRYGERVHVVHLTDSTRTTDGVPFGRGEMAMPTLSRILKEEFDGTVVLEVMPDHQRGARRRFERA